MAGVAGGAARGDVPHGGIAAEDQPAYVRIPLHQLQERRLDGLPHQPQPQAAAFLDLSRHH